MRIIIECSLESRKFVFIIYDVMIKYSQSILVYILIIILNVSM